VLVIFIIIYDGDFEHLRTGALLYICAPMFMYHKGTLVKKTLQKPNGHLPSPKHSAITSDGVFEHLRTDALCFRCAMLLGKTPYGLANRVQTLHADLTE
jgi:hypothetical protein